MNLFHSFTPFPQLIVSLILQPLQSAHNCHFPLIKNGGGLLSRKNQRTDREREEKEAEDRQIQGTCRPVCPTKWDFHTSSHCSATASSLSSKVKLAGSLLSFKNSQSCAAAWQPWAPERPKLTSCKGLFASPHEREEEFKLNSINHSRAYMPTSYWRLELSERHQFHCRKFIRLFKQSWRKLSKIDIKC